MKWQDPFRTEKIKCRAYCCQCSKGKSGFLLLFHFDSLLWDLFDLKHFFINCAFQNKIAEFCCRWCNKDIFFQNLSYLCQFAGRLQNDPNTCSGHHHFVLDLLKKRLSLYWCGNSHLISIPSHVLLRKKHVIRSSSQTVLAEGERPRARVLS